MDLLLEVAKDIFNDIPIKCEYCENKYYSQKNLKKHIIEKHYFQQINININIYIDKNIFKCKLCNYSTIHKRNIGLHIKSIHYKIRDWKCHLCNYESTQKRNLNRHIKAIHYNIRDFECTYCNYKCSQKYFLKKHIEIKH